MEPTAPPPLRAPVPAAVTPRLYRAGTLRYTAGGLAVLSIWLLWGDFAFTFFENIFGRFMPFYLKDLHASNALIGVMTGSFAGLVNILFLPNLSRWSDNHRGPLGRRIPFLYVVTPLAVAALVGIGFVPEIAGWLHRHLFFHVAPSVTEAAVFLPLLCVLVVSFHFFNMVLVNAYNWLLRDVVPQEMMARFLSCFRIVGSASTFAFLWWVFPHMMAHRKEVFLGVGLFYLAAFLLMCRNVREGEYPPPPAKEDRPGLAASFGLYFRECLRLPIYRNFFIGYVLASMALGCAGPFAALFTRETLGLDMETMGKLFAWGGVPALVLYYPTGALCDRLGPLRVTLWAMAGVAAVSVIGFYYVVSPRSFLAYSLVLTIPAVGWGIGALSATMKLFPQEKFGQFYSGINVFSCGAMIVGNYAIGKFMDLVGSNYRMTFLWTAALLVVALYPMALVYRDWKRYGGPHAYVAPLPTP
ncbi:MFS-type transporter involved in bile tolerance, Atg22 family [Verrucomicrobium sp. GAS474]|uniref:MFS transporter n=1 Tax=Verrucomicrobium sp. GAS474 TaxID=1882831 RepID=UPI00087BC58C|nr:MFS transporter [Verrucomicrobium sp. GAS474]SDT92923.1 MFS-type transporter involved in bile tolerance, Atg22 family [Verrucomicrobium sp. GAS474]